MSQCDPDFDAPCQGPQRPDFFRSEQLHYLTTDQRTTSGAIRKKSSPIPPGTRASSANEGSTRALPQSTADFPHSLLHESCVVKLSSAGRPMQQSEAAKKTQGTSPVGHCPHCTLVHTATRRGRPPSRTGITDMLRLAPFCCSPWARGR